MTPKKFKRKYLNNWNYSLCHKKTGIRKSLLLYIYSDPFSFRNCLKLRNFKGLLVLIKSPPTQTYNFQPILILCLCIFKLHSIKQFAFVQGQLAP